MKFKVGDRVAIFGYHGSRLGSGNADFYARGTRATVVQVCNDSEIIVKSGRSEFEIHPKQCRRLVKKERRRMWLDFDGGRNTIGNGVAYPAYHANYGGYYTEFVEVKRKKR